MLQLREKQLRAKAMLRDGFRNHRAQILYAPTGSGKTEISIDLLVSTSAKGNRSCMVLDRRILCEQTSKRMEKYLVDHGVIMAKHPRYLPNENIQVCSAQTLEKLDQFPSTQLLVVDECHAQRKSVTDFIKNTDIKVIGLSASPFTKGLGNVYTNVINGATTKELVDDGLLAPLRVFIAREVDMTGAKKIGGEWSDREVSDRAILITGDVVGEWIKKTNEIFGGPRKTIVFSADVDHGMDLAKQFNERGYDFISISYRDDDDYKREVIEDFSKPDTQIHGLIATDILTKGFDVSDVMIGISARPFSKSFSSHVQQMGRVMRGHPGKEFAVWIDHSGNYLRFLDQWDYLYSNGVNELKEGAEKVKKEPSEKLKKECACPKCGALWGNADACTHCGYVIERTARVIDIPGEVVELNKANEPKTKKLDYSVEEREAWYRQLIKYCNDNGKKPGMAWHRYKEKFGVYPANSFCREPFPYVSSEVLSFIRHKNIKYANRSGK